MTSSTLDRTVLDHLRTALGDETGEFSGQLITTYLSQAAVLVDNLESANEQEDLPSLMFTAHTLKGSSATMGGRRLAELCNELEHWMGSPLEARPLVIAVQQEAAALNKGLAAYS